jgi:hypothetical protein
VIDETMSAMFDYRVLRSSGKFYDAGKHLLVTKAPPSLTSRQARAIAGLNAVHGSRMFYQRIMGSFYRAKSRPSI